MVITVTPSSGTMQPAPCNRHHDPIRAGPQALGDTGTDASIGIENREYVEKRMRMLEGALVGDGASFFSIRDSDIQCLMKILIH